MGNIRAAPTHEQSFWRSLCNVGSQEVISMQSRRRGPIGLGAVGALTVTLGLAACGTTETRVASPEGPPAPVVVQGSRIEPGTQLTVQIDQPIGKDTAIGQPYTGRVVQAIVDEAGDPIVPVGSQVQGRVAAIQRAKGKQPAAVDLTVETLQVRGVVHPIDGRIVATDIEASSHGVNGLHVAAGTAGGALLGGILGGWTGAVVGGIAGAITGTAVSLGLSGHEAKLPAGTALVIELKRPIAVAALRGPRAAQRGP
jgi:hypothetical protein